MLAPTSARAASRLRSRHQQAVQQPRTRRTASAALLLRASSINNKAEPARSSSSATATATATAQQQQPELHRPALISPQQQQQLLSMAVAAAPASALAALALALAAADPASAAAAADPQHAASSAPIPLYALSEGEDFFANVARYGRYFVTVMLGTGYMMAKPVIGLVKKGPLTAALTVGGGLVAFYGVKFTLDAMLGLSDAGLTYDPDLAVTRALMKQG